MTPRAWHPRMRLPDFLEWEAHQEERWELVAGTAHRVPRPDAAHEAVLAALADALETLLAGQGLAVYRRARVITPAGDALYPDVVVALDDAPPGATRIAQTRLVAEVLAPGGEGLDRGRKWEAARGIPSLTHYLLADPECGRLESFSRTPDGGWAWRETGPGEGLDLPALGTLAWPADVQTPRP